VIHHLFGISTQTLVGWLFLAFIPAIIVTLLLVIAIQQRQLKQGQDFIAYRLGAPAPRQRGKVIAFRRRSG
jgi:hypothetical protein